MKAIHKVHTKMTNTFRNYFSVSPSLVVKAEECQALPEVESQVLYYKLPGKPT